MTSSLENTWVSPQELMRAGAGGKTIVAHLDDGSWESRRREDDGTFEFRVGSLPARLQKKLAAALSRRESPASDARELVTRARLGELPTELREAVRDELSAVIGSRLELLEVWRNATKARLRGECGRKIAIQWVELARTLGRLYPTLLVFPLPSELDRLVAAMDRDPQDTALRASLVIDLEHLQLNTKAVSELAAKEAAR